MSLELAVELRRLKVLEGQLAILEREAAELTETMLLDVRDGHPTESLRMMMAAIQADVRDALQKWQEIKRQVAKLLNEPQAGRRRRETSSPAQSRR